VRRLYEKYLEVRFGAGFWQMIFYFYFQFDPSNSSAWIKYAELETQLEDFSRARAIFELGVSQSPLSMPELLWKAYIDFEIEEGERETARSLYERLIALSGHVKVWISYALFEGEAIPIRRALREEEDEEGDGEEGERAVQEGDADIARRVFEQGYKDLKSKDLKSEVRVFFGFFFLLV
jgi:crooked neck